MKPGNENYFFRYEENAEYNLRVTPTTKGFSIWN
jgi:hypothetical protein